jgi:Metallo-peptidase family M12B Reprolysin-like
MFSNYELCAGPAVPNEPVSFVTVSGPELVGGGAGDGPVCCQDDHLISCVTANIQPAALGQPGRSIGLPNNIVVSFVRHIGDNEQAFYYENNEGASATITCSGKEEDEEQEEEQEEEDQDMGCHGQATNGVGETFVLEYCGDEGHVWKQANVTLLADSEPNWNGEEDLVALQELQADEEKLVGAGEGLVTYSIKFYYTGDFLKVAPNVLGFVNQVVSLTNQAYINSKVPLSASVLCVEPAVGFKETNDIDTDFNNFAQFKGSTDKLRDTADVAVLLVSKLNDNFCGRANIAPYGTRAAISMVAKVCAESLYTVAHEIGHNFGLQHDPPNADLNNLILPYATGHLIAQGKSKNSAGFRSIMAYGTWDHQIRVNYFSSPDVIYPETGTPTGLKTSNNAQVLRSTRFALAGLGNESSQTCRGGKVVQPSSRSNDVAYDEENEENE